MNTPADGILHKTTEVKMAKKDERNLNITIKNQEEEKGNLLISISDVLKNMKRYLAVWLVAAIVFGIITACYVSYKTSSYSAPINALVSFSYDGIEKGKDPSGRDFDINSVKNPTVVTAALTELNMDISHLDGIREGITFSGFIPEDAINRITAYKSVYESGANGSLSAAEAMLDVTYYPTKFEINFDYSKAGLSRKDGVQVLNQILECYKDYFYDQYGFNSSLGIAVPAVSYTDYDYAEQVDVFRTTLETLERYIKQLANDDTTLFRSTATGYTFNDLYQAATTIESIDLDRISSYISVNNITNDKEASIAYYDYRIENLTRTQAQLEERLASVNASIAQYQKDAVIILNGGDSPDASYTQTSDEYDKLFENYTSISTDLASTKQNIEFYKARREALNGDRNATSKQKEQVETDLASLSEKLSNLVSLTEQTADEYYEDVAFANAYSILVPAVNSAGATLHSIISSCLIPVIMVEALVFIVYLIAAFVKSLKLKPKKKAAEGDDDDEAAEPEEAAEAVAEVIEEVSAEETDKTETKKKK